jgi:hypothetical protein
LGRVRLRVTFGTRIRKGNDVHVGLNLSDEMVFSLWKLSPRSVSSAVTDLVHGFREKRRRTILFIEEGFVDDVMIIHIKMDFVIVKVKINDVTHRHPSHIVARGTRTPVFTQVSKHIDMIAQKDENRLGE